MGNFILTPFFNEIKISTNNFEFSFRTEIRKYCPAKCIILLFTLLIIFDSVVHVESGKYDISTQLMIACNVNINLRSKQFEQFALYDIVCK